MGSPFTQTDPCRAAAGCDPHVRDIAFPEQKRSPLGDLVPINPLEWLGDAATGAVADVWKAAMVALWSAGLWCMELSFRVIDQFTTPDLSGDGPIGPALPITLWLGGTVAVVMMFAQLIIAVARQDGKSLGRIALGVAQFGLVWLGYLALGAAMVTAAAGLTRGILSSMLDIDAMAELDLSATWPRDVNDTTVATVLGVLSLLLIIPCAFFYILIMFVREAALIILLVTAPITAAGLVNDTAKTWFWKSLRWFVACLLVSPTMALVLGIGVKVSEGVVAGQGDDTAAAAGMAVVGTVMIAVGAVCPLVLFRLMAFMEPGTASGAALRQSWSDAGGMTGLLGGGRARPGGSTAATHSGADGRSGGEAGAEAATQSRLASLLGGFGTAMQTVTSMAQQASDVGTDVLGQTGIGSAGYSPTPTDERISHRSGGYAGRGGPGADEHGNGDGPGPGGGAPSGPPPEPPPPPAPRPPSPRPGPAPTSGAPAAADGSTAPGAIPPAPGDPPPVVP